MLGPRIGKYDREGKVKAIPGHNMMAVALGVFILWFCWFGFNGGSTASMADGADAFHASLAFMNTNLAAAVATVVTMVLTWLRYGKPDVSMTLNAALAGLVAITAGCDCVTPFGAFAIGLVAGVLVVFSVEFFDNVAKIDDPVGAVSVHMANGIWGTLAVGLFSNGEDGVMTGLFYGGGAKLLGVQALGILAIDAYVLIVMFIVVWICTSTAWQAPIPALLSATLPTCSWMSTRTQTWVRASMTGPLTPRSGQRSRSWILPASLQLRHPALALPKHLPGLGLICPQQRELSRIPASTACPSSAVSTSLMNSSRDSTSWV